MYQDEIILCSASKYTQKYYLNEDFDNLPTEVKKELRILCIPLHLLSHTQSIPVGRNKG